MPDLNPQLLDKFKQWANGPDTELTVAPPPGITGALEAGLWAAYQAGYRQALSDCDGVRRVVSELQAKQQP